MAFKDNREFIKALDKTQDVVHVQQEVDWDMEVGAIVRRTCELRGPAVLFENIKDYEGQRILGAPLATYRRLAIAMGLSPEIPIRELHEEYAKRSQTPIKPVVVKDGPCKENIVLGNDVDLYNLPAPVVHGGDGGRYIGTWHCVVNKDPDSDWTNWGLYRVMIHNRNHLTGLIVHEINQSGVIYFSKYVPKNKTMPVAIVIGADPLCVAMAADPIPMNCSEADFAGGLRQEPVELIKCETSDLLVPAHAEIVIEGEMSPADVRVHEGPFGEYPGYRTQSVKARNVMKVTAITYRNKPILTMTNMGVPVDEGALIGTVTTAIRLKERLKRKGVPVIDVYLPPETAAHIAFISVPANHAPDVAVQVREAIIARRSQVPKAIVVDEDVDVFDVGQVIHAFATKCHPIRGITARAHQGAIDLTPFLDPDERFKGHGATAVFDCTWPVDWSLDFDRPLRVSFNEVYPKEVKDKILKNWQTYGFK